MCFGPALNVCCVFRDPAHKKHHFTERTGLFWFCSLVLTEVLLNSISRITEYAQLHQGRPLSAPPVTYKHLWCPEAAVIEISWQATGCTVQ